MIQRMSDDKHRATICNIAMNYSEGDLDPGLIRQRLDTLLDSILSTRHDVHSLAHTTLNIQCNVDPVAC